MDKSVFEIKPLEEQGNDSEYWASKTPAERVQALEYMRQVMYGYDPAVDHAESIEIKQQLWSRFPA